MHVFDLWSPSLTDEHTVEFDVTASFSAGILHQPDRTWIEQALAALGFAATPREWSVVPARMNFYSDYVEEDVWQDRWQKGWVVRVKCSEAVSHPPDTAWEPHPLDVADLSARGVSDVAPYDRTAVVAAVFFDRPEKQDAVRNELEARKRRERPDDPARLDFSTRAAGGSWQFRVIVTGAQFPDCVPLVDMLRDALKEQGAAISWKGTLARRSPQQTQHTTASVPATVDLDLTTALAGLTPDADDSRRAAAFKFFYLHPDAPDHGALIRALQSRSPSPDEGQRPGHPQWLYDLGRALAVRAEAGDSAATDALRGEALAPGRAGAVYFPLFMIDRAWLLEHAADVVSGTPHVAAPLFRQLIGASIELGPVIQSLRGRVPRHVVEHALADNEVTDAPRLLGLFDAKP